jgi:hypothetical protein
MSLARDASVFVAGLLCGGYGVAAAFFLRFWSTTKDRFFGLFSTAFWLMAANQAVASFARSARGEEPLAYLLRLGAFILVIVALMDKNLSASRSAVADSRRGRPAQR